MRGNYCFAVLSIVSQRAEDSLAIAPVFLNFYPKVQAHMAAEQTLDVRPRFGSHFFEHGAAFAHDDTGMGFSLAVDHRIDIDEIACFPLMHAFDRYGDPVRDLRAEQSEQLLADDLRYHDPLRFGRNDIVRIILRALGHQRDELCQQRVHPVVFLRRNRDHPG